MFVPVIVSSEGTVLENRLYSETSLCERCLSLLISLCCTCAAHLAIAHQADLLTPVFSVTSSKRWADLGFSCSVGSALLMTHWRIQIVGDETTALESVLRADVWRHKLMTEEAELNAKLEQLEQKTAQDGEAEVIRINMEKDELAARLGEIQKNLLDMEAETGPARASSLLAGLGFDDEDQKKTTKSFSGGWR